MTSSLKDPRRLRISIGTRIAAMTTLVLLMASALVFLQLTQRERERLVASKQSGAEMVVRLLATDVSAALELGDGEDVSAQLAKLRSNPAVTGAAIWRSDGEEPLAEWGRRPSPGRSTREPRAPKITEDAIELAEPIAGIAGAPLGTLRVGFSLAAENEAYRDSRRLMFLVSLTLAMVTAGLLILITRREVLAPLAHLSAAVRRMERGEPGAKVALSSADELGTLGRAFNAMADAVALRQRELEATEARFRMLIETMPDAVTLSQDGKITYANPALLALVGREEREVTGISLDRLLVGHASRDLGSSVAREERWALAAGTAVVEVHERAFSLGGVAATMLIARDMTEQRRLEAQLLQTDKLASIGTLAAGVAHEINTPLQYVSHNVIYASGALEDIALVAEKHRALREAVLAGAPTDAAATEAMAAEEQLQTAALLTDVPRALASAVAGIQRIAAIVKSLKIFAHPDREEKEPADLNAAVTSTLAVACNEYKYVADVDTDLGELPPVTCHVGDVNQAILNVVVNASHAIADVVGSSGARGRISVRTRRDGDDVVISIHDTGGGIPETIRARVFDPFFTTKDVGRGTGQGLSIARAVVVERHGGTITFETEPGSGTTFEIRLPIVPPLPGSGADRASRTSRPTGRAAAAA